MELLPCPFCGSKEIKLHQQHWHMSRKAQCVMCHSEATYDRENEIKIWNTRHSPWISVKERLPDNEDKALIVTKFPENFLSIMSQRYDQKFGHYYKESKEWNILHNIYDLEVTHWMPLPSLPEEK